jgi:uncharacterized protein with GYD domain
MVKWRGNLLFFITLTRWKTAPTKEIIDQATKTFEDMEKQGVKIRVYWTLGRYDAVSIIEAPTEKDAVKILLGFQGLIDTETMVAVPREEAIKLL